jgi:DNA-binding phage protein
VVANLAQSVELKRLRADAAEPTPHTMRGLTIPRPVRVVSIEHIGREVIVDPTDANEDVTAEMLSATEVLMYENAAEKLDALRAKIRAAGIKSAARESGVSRSEIQAIVNGGKTPHKATVAKLDAALGSSGN